MGLASRLKRRWFKLTSIRPGEDIFQASSLRRILSATFLPIVPPVFMSAFTPAAMAIKRFRFRNNYAGQTRLHLACGTNLIDGWANVDLYANAGVLGWDLTKELPLESATVARIFSEHFIEHIPKCDAASLLEECCRVLQDGGVLRLSTPDLAVLVECYTNQTPLYWESVGWAPESPCDLINQGLSLWGHQYLYDRDELRKCLLSAGFSVVTFVGWRESEYSDLNGLEVRPFFQELIVEAQK